MLTCCGYMGLRPYCRHLVEGPLPHLVGGRRLGWGAEQVALPLEVARLGGGGVEEEGALGVGSGCLVGEVGPQNLRKVVEVAVSVEEVAPWEGEQKEGGWRKAEQKEASQCVAAALRSLLEWLGHLLSLRNPLSEPSEARLSDITEEEKHGMLKRLGRHGAASQSRTHPRPPFQPHRQSQLLPKEGNHHFSQYAKTMHKILDLTWVSIKKKLATSWHHWKWVLCAS